MSIRASEADKRKYSRTKLQLRFQATFRERRGRLEEDLLDELRAREQMIDPSKAYNVNKVLDDNLELMLVSSEANRAVAAGYAHQQDVELIKEHVEAMMADLEGRSQSMLANKAGLQAAKHRALAAQFAGSRVDYLVQKFVVKLK